MKLNEREKYANLFEKYKNLLAQSQKQSLELYLFEDLNISEIATIVVTTRQAINDSIKKGLKKLDDLEAKLNDQGV